MQNAGGAGQNGAPRTYGNDGGGGAQANGGGSNAYADLPPGSRKIMAAFERLGPTESLPTDGVPLEQICSNAGLSAEAGAEALDYLVSEGYLFSASDDRSAIACALTLLTRPQALFADELDARHACPGCRPCTTLRLSAYRRAKAVIQQDSSSTNVQGQ